MLGDFLQGLFIKFQINKSGKYLSVRGKDIYYETYGEGEPLLMFHGGLSSLDTFRYQIPFLSQYYQVILPLRPGNAHTADIDSHYNYEEMAEDMIAFMDILKIDKAKMIGYSDGANLIFFIALQAMQRIDRFISIGGNFHHEGCVEEFQDELKKIPRDSTGEGVDRNYEKYSPDGVKHFSESFYKHRKLWLEEPKLTSKEIEKISSPALIMAGDKDVIKPEHTLELFRALKNAELCILPNTTHGLIKEEPQIVNKILYDFLKKEFDTQKDLESAIYDA